MTEYTYEEARDLYQSLVSASERGSISQVAVMLYMAGVLRGYTEAGMPINDPMFIGAMRIGKSHLEEVNAT